MKNLIITFKSRNELYNFANILKRHGIVVSIINSPKSIGSSCMLSIKTDFKNLNLISQILRQVKLRSFLGLYSIQITNNGEQTLRILWSNYFINVLTISLNFAIIILWKRPMRF